MFLACLLIAVAVGSTAPSPQSQPPCGGAGLQPCSVTRLRADGRAFRTADGSRFSWRGLTAFRPVEMVAHGRTADAIAVRAVPRRAGEPGAAVVSFDTARAEDLFLAQGDGREWAVAVGVKEDPALRWRAGWRVVSTKRYPGVVVIAARK